MRGIVRTSALGSLTHMLSLAIASVEQSLDGAPSCISRESAIPDRDTHTSVSIAPQGAPARTAMIEMSPALFIVIPAKAGIHLAASRCSGWIPAFAGMTIGERPSFLAR